MRPIKLLPTIVLVLAGTLSLSNICNGIMFTNMGGSLKAQSANGASAFLRAAGATYTMFAKIETAAIGDYSSLKEAAVEAKRSIESIKAAVEQFKSISHSKRQLKKLDSDIQWPEVAYASAVQKAAIFLEPKIVVQIKDVAMKEGALGLLNLSIINLESLISSDSHMGKVYNQIISGTIPDKDVLWAAAKELDIALQIGRLTSSLLGDSKMR